ncbi:LysR family transcriptional regulator [uncultured Paracoccus sp.]|uniref:LysR family transcriptional regulator n=1 Tax=uncultured Paracoccus sp. TaxID=189685 RepID=UPI0025DC2448|nr:LysR family transcriptional regulator [uncultured Paracoccus sp.]
MNLSRSRIPDLAQLQAFEAAARYESFTHAATELNLSQSAVSRQIRELEARLGLELFERVRQRVILSENGKRLLADARALLERAEDMTLRALGSRGLTGVLSVATLPTFGSRWLIPRIPAFLASEPGVQASIASRAAPFDFAVEPFDIAIHFGRPSWPQASCTFLCDEVVIPVAAPGIASGDPAEVAALPLLQITHRPRLWAQWFDLQGIEARNAYNGHRFDSFSMLISAAIAGLGVALLPACLIETELAAGQLQPVADRPLTTDQCYYTVVPDGKTGNPLVSGFQDWLGAQMAEAQPVAPGQGPN